MAHLNFAWSQADFWDENDVFSAMHPNAAELLICSFRLGDKMPSIKCLCVLLQPLDYYNTILSAVIHFQWSVVKLNKSINELNCSTCKNEIINFNSIFFIVFISRESIICFIINKLVRVSASLCALYAAGWCVRCAHCVTFPNHSNNNNSRNQYLCAFIWLYRSSCVNAVFLLCFCHYVSVKCESPSGWEKECKLIRFSGVKSV